MNLPLAAATGVVVLAGLWFGVTVLAVRADLRVAKEDAYDSLLVLFSAKAEVAQLRAAMSLWLLDPEARPAAEARMAAARQALIGIDLSSPDAVTRLRGSLDMALDDERAGRTDAAHRALGPMGGYLGTELANITFGMPERQAATDAVLALAAAMVSVGSVQDQERRRDHVFAVVDWLREGPGGGAAAFLAVQAALTRTIEVNQSEFDRRDERARRTRR